MVYELALFKNGGKTRARTCATRRQSSYPPNYLLKKSKNCHSKICNWHFKPLWKEYGDPVSQIPSANVGLWVRVWGKSFHRAGRPGKRFLVFAFPFPFSVPVLTRERVRGTQPRPSRRRHSFRGSQRAWLCLGIQAPGVPRRASPFGCPLVTELEERGSRPPRG